jgi:hypothetical protein
MGMDIYGKKSIFRQLHSAKITSIKDWYNEIFSGVEKTMQ